MTALATATYGITKLFFQAFLALWASLYWIVSCWHGGDMPSFAIEAASIIATAAAMMIIFVGTRDHFQLWARDLAYWTIMASVAAMTFSVITGPWDPVAPLVIAASTFLIWLFILLFG